MMRLTVFAAVLVSGCGGLSYTVERDLLRDISIENKLTLFDAENDVSIALDERESLRSQIKELRQDLEDADAQVDEAASDEARANQKDDAKGAEVAAMARDVFKRKIDYLNAQVGLLRKKLRAQDDLVMVAEAKFELAKAKLVKKNNVFGASDITIEDFEAQVDKVVEKAKGTQGDLTEEEQAVEAVKNEWLTQRQALAQASGGGAGTPWAEDSASWGNE